MPLELFHFVLVKLFLHGYTVHARCNQLVLKYFLSNLILCRLITVIMNTYVKYDAEIKNHFITSF